LGDFQAVSTGLVAATLGAVKVILVSADGGMAK
jgi:hypothetical protein